MREEALGGRAALAVNCVPSVVPVTPGEARLRRARRRRMVKKVAASTPVVSAARSETPTPAYCPWHAATELRQSRRMSRRRWRGVGVYHRTVLYWIRKVSLITAAREILRLVPLFCVMC